METAAHIRLILWKTAKAIEKADRASIADTGLILSDFTIMEVLLHRGSLPINTIGEKVLLTSGSMTAAINRLEIKGVGDANPRPLGWAVFPCPPDQVWTQCHQRSVCET